MDFFQQLAHLFERQKETNPEAGAPKPFTASTEHNNSTWTAAMKHRQNEAATQVLHAVEITGHNNPHR
jgi:hypothetical protein